MKKEKYNATFFAVRITENSKINLIFQKGTKIMEGNLEENSLD
jgi:hypothetical protein